jgi:hypothetical protein
MATIRFLNGTEIESENFFLGKENVKHRSNRELMRLSPVFMNNPEGEKRWL